MQELNTFALHFSRIRLVRLFKGEKEVAVEQKGEPLGPHIKAELENGVESSADEAMEE